MFKAVVSANKKIGYRFYKLKLTFSKNAAKAFADFIPGQFLEIDISNISGNKSNTKFVPDLLANGKRSLKILKSFIQLTTSKIDTPDIPR